MSGDLVPVIQQVGWYRPVDEDLAMYGPRISGFGWLLHSTAGLLVFAVVLGTVVTVGDPAVVADAVIVAGMVIAVGCLAYVGPGFGARGLHVVLAAAWATIVHLLPESRAAAGAVFACLVLVPVGLWWVGRRRDLMGEWLAAGAVHAAAAVLLLFPAAFGHHP